MKGKMKKSHQYVLIATVLSLALSIYLFFFMDSPDAKLYGIYVGLWVPQSWVLLGSLKQDAKKMGLIDFFNDPNSAIIFLLGIGVSAIFLIGVSKSLYGPRK